MKTVSVMGADWRVVRGRATTFVVAFGWTSEATMKQLGVAGFSAAPAEGDDLTNGIAVAAVKVDRLASLLSCVCDLRSYVNIAVFPTLEMVRRYANAEMTASEYEALPWSGYPRYEVRHEHAGETRRDVGFVAQADAEERARKLKSIANGKVTVVDKLAAGESVVYVAP